MVDSESSEKPKTITKTIKRKIKTREFNMEEIGMINQRNMELIQTLRTLDSAFSMGESGKLLFLNIKRCVNVEIEICLLFVYMSSLKNLFTF